jgi:hypothetical protein
MRFANQTSQTIAVFGPDPNNRAIRWFMRRQWYDDQSHFTSPYGPSELNPGRFNPGYINGLQDFVSYNQSGGSTVPFRTGAYPQTDSAVITGPMGDPTRRIFAERLARRKAV